MPYIIFQTIDADISVHFSRFNYNSFSVNGDQNNEIIKNRLEIALVKYQTVHTNSFWMTIFTEN